MLPHILFILNSILYVPSIYDVLNFGISYFRHIQNRFIEFSQLQTLYSQQILFFSYNFYQSNISFQMAEIYVGTVVVSFVSGFVTGWLSRGQYVQKGYTMDGTGGGGQGNGKVMFKWQLKVIDQPKQQIQETKFKEDVRYCQPRLNKVFVDKDLFLKNKVLKGEDSFHQCVSDRSGIQKRNLKLQLVKV